MRIILLLVPIFVNIFGIISGEYFIKDDSIPSYMFVSFNNIEEDIFPQNIRIRLSLNKLAGTLLYSIDRHMNQLIMSLDQGMTSILIVQFRGQKWRMSLQELCGCKVCLYQMFDLLVVLRESIYIQCNDGKLIENKYLESIKLDENFPNPFSNHNPNEKSGNEAYLWLINTPRYENINPNKKQLSGCVYSVSYKDQPVSFTNISEGITNKCSRACNDAICNGGQCHDTFQDRPVCDCTLTFFNGPYCNDLIGPINKRAINNTFQFDVIKVTWKSSENEILTLKNRIIRIHLHCIGRSVFLEYSFDRVINIKATLTQNYVPNKESIFIAYFNDATIDVQFYNNELWIHSTLPNTRDLKNEIFDYLTIKSGDGVIDMVYMILPMSYEWSRLVTSTFEDVPIVVQVTRESGHNLGVTKMSEKHNETTIAVVIVLVLVFILVIVLVIILLVKWRGAQWWSKHDDTSAADVYPSQSENLIENNNEDLSESTPEINDTYPAQLRILRAKQREQEQKACIYWKSHPYGAKVPHYVLLASVGVHIMRAKINKDWIIGRFRSGDKFGYLPFNRFEVPTAELELLCYSENFGYGKTIEWVNDSNGHVPVTAIIGGHTGTNTPLYIAKGEVDGEIFVGKVDPNLKCASVPYKGRVKELKVYDVLCYK